LTAHAYASPITRCTYVEIGDVPRPATAATALIRTPDWTALRVHPGSDTPQIVEEIVHEHHILREEAAVWLGGFTLPADPQSVSEFLADPIGFLLRVDPDALSIPCQATSIPVPLRAPGLRYG
jgi:hypothetical protein